MLQKYLKNGQRSGRLLAVVLLAVSVTGCIVLPFGGGRGHRGHHYNSEASAATVAPHHSQAPAPTWRTPDGRRGR